MSSTSFTFNAKFFLLFSCFAAGAAMSNNYILQPVLPSISESMNISLSMSGYIAASTQIGYMFGILLLIPLGDLYSKKKLILIQFVILAFALLGAAFATNIIMFLVLCVIMGLMATNAIQINAFGYQVDPRGQTVGLITMGISTGILLARLIGGAVSDLFGWRTMLLIVALVTGLLCLIGLYALPKVNAPKNNNYTKLLNDIPILLRNKQLKEACLVGGAWFFVFSMLWVVITLHLQGPTFNLLPSIVGLFGLAGIVGLLTATYAGRLSDKIGIRNVILLGMLSVLLGIIVLALSRDSIVGIVIGIALFDLGCFSAQIANQTNVLALNNEYRSSIYAIYMFFYYACGALGSLTSPIIYILYGWFAVCIISAAIIGFALVLTLYKIIQNKNIVSNNQI